MVRSEGPRVLLAYSLLVSLRHTSGDLKHEKRKNKGPEWSVRKINQVSPQGDAVVVVAAVVVAVVVAVWKWQTSSSCSRCSETPASEVDASATKAETSHLLYKSNASCQGLYCFLVKIEIKLDKRESSP